MRAEVPKESPTVYQIDDENIYYYLTLDPTIKDHRIIALIIDHSSKQGECVFYKADDPRRQCHIAPRFMVMPSDCRGKCFVHGLTCPVILEYIENNAESGNKKNLPDAVGNATDPS